MTRRAASFASALAVILAGTASTASAHDDVVEIRDLARSSAEPVAVTAYLHRHGGRFLGGSDDPRSRRSGVLGRKGLDAVDIPRFSGSDAQWTQLVGCVENHFRAFDVEVVDVRPPGNRYVTLVVGGSPELLGLKSSISGIAPHSGAVLPKAIAFVFEAPRRSVRSMCDTAAHELGHTIGLEHSRNCRDLMSYEDCGPKTFRDVEARCGEWSARACENGARTQNTWASLARLVGRRRDSAVPTSPRRPTPRPRTPGTKRSPAVGLSVRVYGVEAGMHVIRVDAHDPAGVRDVELIWFDQRARKLTCGKPNPDRPFSCKRSGSRYTFRVPARSGSGSFAARFINGKGQLRRTDARSLSHSNTMR